MAGASSRGSRSPAKSTPIYALVTNPGSLPRERRWSGLREWIWAPGFGLILCSCPLLFPDGQPAVASLEVGGLARLVSIG